MENENVETVETIETVTEPKVFNIDDFLKSDDFRKILDSNADKRVTTAMQKKDAEYKAKLEDADKKSKMTAEELQATRETELAERETKIQAYELKLSKLDLFKNKGYDLDLADHVSGNTIEEIEANVESLNVVINKLVALGVEKQVAERLRGGYVPPTGTKATTGVTKEDFAKMTYKEKSKMYTENQELYKQLTK